MNLMYRWIDVRHIESNTGKSARQGYVSPSCTICRCLILFLTFISSCVLFDSYVLLADDHVNNVSYFSFMSIKKVIPYFCVLREGYYVIIWLIVRDRPFNLKGGGGYGFLFRSGILFRTTQE